MRVADEAFALDGTRAAETYLDIAKLLDVARRSGADAVHPGYGFLAENAGFAQAVIDAGLTWIGPPPAAIDALGDKVSARHIAQRAGAPLVAGTPDPVERRRGGPRLRRRARPARRHQGGVRRRRPRPQGGARVDEIDELFESATREAVAAFGRGECFVERYLDKPRHVETQCLADAARHGRRRLHARLLAPASAPEARRGGPRAVPHRRAEHPARRVEQGDPARGQVRRRRHCEFLVGARRHHLLPRGQHPPAGGAPRHRGGQRHRPGTRAAAHRRGRAAAATTTSSTRGHSIEFRINGEDPAANFLPAPGPIAHPAASRPDPASASTPASSRATASRGHFDSMIAKVVVTGATRTQAIERARRALAELEVVGIPTVVPFHRAVLEAPAFAPSDPTAAFRVHTRWIETEFADTVAALGARPRLPARRGRRGRGLERVVVEVGGKRLEVVLPAALALSRGGAPADPVRRTARRAPQRPGSRLVERHHAHLADAGHDRQGRRRRGRARWPRATSSSCSRR